MVEFQSIAKTLVHANEAGYLDGLRPHRESSTSNGWYDLVVVMNGLSYKGEAFLTESVARNAVKANESISRPDRGVRVTLDTNCVINLFDRQSSSASSVPELSTLIKFGLSGKITISITTRVETDLLNDQNLLRRAEMLRTLGNFPIIGTVGRWNTSKWDSGDVFSDDKIQQQCDDIQGIIFPGLQDLLALRPSPHLRGSSESLISMACASQPPRNCANNLHSRWEIRLPPATILIHFLKHQGSDY
jgi:hypothetical protein